MKIINQFSLAEMVSNENGKTSASGVFGSLTITAGIIGFFIGIIYTAIEKKGYGEVLMQSLGMITLGTTLLGLRKYNENKKDE